MLNIISLKHSRWMDGSKKHQFNDFTNIDYSHVTSAHAQKGRGLHEEVLKMLNCGTVCQLSIQKPDTFYKNFLELKLV